MATGADPFASAPLTLKAYRALGGLVGPALPLVLDARRRAGKEDPDRLAERRGVAGPSRPAGRLAWLHGGSVGEALSLLPLAARLKAARPATQILLTTGTVTAARLIAARLPVGAIHQYAPIDRPAYVRRFLDHWRPDAAVFVEAELWPNMVLETRRRARFMALVNARMSPRSFENWRRRARAARCLLSAFDVVMAQDEANAARLTGLLRRTVSGEANLKHAAPSPPTDEAAVAAFRAQIGPRRAWLAASTHEGEEEAAADVHAALVAGFDRLLTIIAPRHPVRADAVAAMLTARGLAVARRSADHEITPETDVYLVDALGELELFYRLAPVAFVGGSFVDVGGHNPLEPARLGSAILVGPHAHNFEDDYAALLDAGAAPRVADADELAHAVERLLKDEAARTRQAAAAADFARVRGATALDVVYGRLRPGLEAALSEGDAA
ncbi:MAG: 3-deoxy-D-manno-octulosonic acid transferase [Parvularculaceae bacterium]